MMVNPIMYAFLDGKNDIVNIMEKFGGNLNKLNKSAQSILHLAAIYKREEAFKTAVSRNMNFNFPDELGNTPFHYAARAGSPSMVNIMIAAKAKKI
jgi:ankyrin repeat protein